MTVSLLENEAGSAVGSSGSAQASQTAAAGGATAADGPSVTISFGDGSSTTLHTEDLQLYIAAIQTLLLLYVTYKEVSR